MPNYTGSFGEVVTRGIKSITAQTNIRQMAAGSKARSLIETHAKEIDNLSVLQNTNLKKAFLPTTFGQFLDHFGAMVGLSRYPQRTAEVLAQDRVFRFYVRGGGTFGSINNGSGFTISAGTRMTSPAAVVYEATSLYGYQEEPDTVYDRSIHYTITEDTPVASDDTEVFVPSKALTPGAGGNLAAPKMIKGHNFTNYDDYLGKSLLCENVKPVLNGVDAESAASYRYRISQALTASEKANYIAIYNAALSVPGVSDAIIIPWEDGAGRFNVYIKSTSSVVSDRTINDVQTAIDSVNAVGTIGFARKPYEIGVEIDSTITFRSDFKDDVKDEIKTGMEITAVRYLNSLAIGQPLILSDLVSQLKQSDNRIATVGFNEKTFFDAVFVWYPAKLAEAGRRRERLVADTLGIPVHARVIAESTIADPVRMV
jgi:uncharacterized phage protein gp47/JayE